MLFIFSTPELIRNLWQLKTAIFLHWCLIFAWHVNYNVTVNNLKIDIWCMVDKLTNFWSFVRASNQTQPRSRRKQPKSNHFGTIDSLLSTVQLNNRINTLFLSPFLLSLSHSLSLVHTQPHRFLHTPTHTHRPLYKHLVPMF